MSPSWEKAILCCCCAETGSAFRYKIGNVLPPLNTRVRGCCAFPNHKCFPCPIPANPIWQRWAAEYRQPYPWRSTLPRAQPSLESPSPNAAAIRNRANRLALVGITWNAYQHLFPYWNEVQREWLAALPKALSQAAIAGDEPAFTAVLQRLAAGLQDGHNFIDRSGRSAYGSHTVPFTMDLVEGQLVVTTFLEAHHHGLRLGDTIARLDGKPALEALAEISERISGSEAYRRYLGLAWLMGGSALSPNPTIKISSTSTSAGCGYNPKHLD